MQKTDRNRDVADGSTSAWWLRGPWGGGPWGSRRPDRTPFSAAPARARGAATAGRDKKGGVIGWARSYQLAVGSATSSSLVAEFLISQASAIQEWGFQRRGRFSRGGGHGISGGAPWKCWFRWGRRQIGDAMLESRLCGAPTMGAVLQLLMLCLGGVLPRYLL